MTTTTYSAAERNAELISALCDSDSYIQAGINQLIRAVACLPSGHRHHVSSTLDELYEVRQRFANEIESLS